jgi:hypothetical protein
MKKRSQVVPEAVEADAPANGKVANDTNKPAAQATQRNEARRTPASRHDRDSQIGSGNQAQMRRGQGGLGR